ncbi:hypothetical protein [Haloarchaeobius sp. DFWS5]|uniref:hypothetical protein n=1 Tax=Haloarchaeobius sp. DFWS5 TaxID=3446114 RepID=UPI003EC0D6A6
MVERQFAEQVVENNPDLTDVSQVRVTNVTGVDKAIANQDVSNPGRFIDADIELTESGEQAVREGYQQAVERTGSTGQYLLDREQDIAQERAEAEFAEDVRTNQFARQRLREQFADANGVDSSELDVAVTRKGLNVGLSEGGQRQALVAAAAAQSDAFSEEDFVAGVSGGEFVADLDRNARRAEIRRQVAAENNVLSEADVRVAFELSPQERNRAAAAGANENERGRAEEAVVSLTEGGRRKLIQQQVAEDTAGVETEDVLVSFDESGQANVELAERFGDDGNRVFGIGGIEDDLENAAEASGDFLRDVGGAAGEAVGYAATGTTRIGLELAGKDSERVTKPYMEFFEGAGEGAASMANVPAVLSSLDETGEFLGYSAAEIVQGNAGELGRDISVETGRLGSGAKDAVLSNPIGSVGTVTGTLLGSYGAIRYASAAGSTSGMAARYAIQPGEELLSAGATRALRTTSRGRRIADQLPGGKIDTEELAVLGAKKVGGRSKAAASKVRRSLAGRIENPRLRELVSTPVDFEGQTGMSRSEFFDLPGERPVGLSGSDVDAAMGVEGPSRTRITMARTKRRLSRTRRQLGELWGNRGSQTERAQLNLVGGEGRNSTPLAEVEEAPSRSSFRDYSKSEVLSNSPRDLMQGDIYDRSLAARRSSSGTLDYEDGRPGGYSRDPTPSRGAQSRRRRAQRSSFEAESELELESAKAELDWLATEAEASSLQADRELAGVSERLLAAEASSLAEDTAPTTAFETQETGQYEKLWEETGLEEEFRFEQETETEQRQEYRGNYESEFEYGYEFDYETVVPDPRTGVEPEPRRVPDPDFDDDPQSQPRWPAEDAWGSGSETWENPFADSEDVVSEFFGGGR